MQFTRWAGYAVRADGGSLLLAKLRNEDDKESRRPATLGLLMAVEATMALATCNLLMLVSTRPTLV